MVQISIEQFTNDPQGLLDRMAAGETLVLTHSNRPVAEVHPVADKEGKARHAGSCRGEFVVPDDFDAPLPEEILREFYGG